MNKLEITLRSGQRILQSNFDSSDEAWEFETFFNEAAELTLTNA